MKDKVLILGLIILAVGVSIFGLGKASFNQDELALLHHQSLSFSVIIDICRDHLFHPPLFYFFLKIWVFFSGLDELAARSSSIPWFVLTALLPVLHKRKFGFHAWIFSIMLISSFPILYYARQVSPYSMALFFTTFAIILSIDSSLEWKKLGLLGALAFLTHYLAGVFYFTTLATFLLSSLVTKSKESIRFFLKSMGLTSLLILPWIMYCRVFQKMPIGKDLYFWNPARNQMRQLESVVIHLFSDSYWLLGFCLAIFLVAIIIKRFKVQPFVVSTLAILAIFIGGLYLRSLQYNSVLIPRYFIWLVPLIYMALLSVTIPRTVWFALGFLLVQTTGSISYIHNWQDVRAAFKDMEIVSSKSNCTVQPYLLAFNHNWFNPYLPPGNELTECNLRFFKHEICNEESMPAKFLLEHPEPFMIAFIPSECSSFLSLGMMRPEVGRLASYAFYKVYYQGVKEQEMRSEDYLDFLMEKGFGQK